MIRIGTIVGLVLALSACGRNASDPPDWGTGLQPEQVQSGFDFLTPETQALQQDAFANPGYLWIDRGQALFVRAPENSQACATCHEEGLPGAAATYPKLDQQSGALVNLEGRINLCRTRHQGVEPLSYESEDLLALTAYVAQQSQGIAQSVSIEGALEQDFENGRDYFFTRRGQLNLSCHQCHDQNWGAQLRGDTISQGHLNGFPAYRLEWQSLGSSHRRLRDCDTGVRAEPLLYGDQRYIEVELYLAARSAGIEMESPAVRR